MTLDKLIKYVNKISAVKVTTNFSSTKNKQARVDKMYTDEEVRGVEIHADFPLTDTRNEEMTL